LGTFLENQEFSKLKFSNSFFIKSWFPSPIFFKEKKWERFDQFSALKNYFENQNFEMFEEVVHNFGKSDGDII
jgi:hypothetical protein